MHCGLRGWGRGRGVQAIRETEHFGKNLGCHLKQIYFWKPPDKFARAHGVDGVGYSSINEPSHRQKPIFCFAHGPRGPLRGAGGPFRVAGLRTSTTQASGASSLARVALREAGWVTTRPEAPSADGRPGASP